MDDNLRPILGFSGRRSGSTAQMLADIDEVDPLRALLADENRAVDLIAAANFYVDWGPGLPYNAAKARWLWEKAGEEGNPIYRAEARAVLAALREMTGIDG